MVKPSQIGSIEAGTFSVLAMLTIGGRSVYVKGDLEADLLAALLAITMTFTISRLAPRSVPLTVP